MCQGAQCRLVVHNGVLYPWNVAQCRFHKPTVIHRYTHGQDRFYKLHTLKFNCLKCNTQGPGPSQKQHLDKQILFWDGPTVSVKAFVRFKKMKQSNRFTWNDRIVLTVTAVWDITCANRCHLCKFHLQKSEICYILLITVSSEEHLFKWLSVTCTSVNVPLAECMAMALIQVTSRTGLFSKWGR